MTEAEWLASDDPARMLELLQSHLSHVQPGAAQYQPPQFKLSDRKLRLFACACHTASTCGIADFLLDGEEGPPPTGPQMTHLLACCHEGKRAETTALKAALLRDIAGDPWKPVPELRRSGGICGGQGLEDLDWVSPWLTWNGGTVPKMAKVIYDGRRFADLPILADALEEAGCDDQAIIRHCRGEEPCTCLYGYGAPPNTPQCRNGWRPKRGPCVRGCAILDLLLGKE